MDTLSNEARNAAHQAAHSAAADKARGRTNELLGTAKAKFGELIGDEQLAAEGYLQNAEGKRDRVKGEIKEKIEDAVSLVKGGVEVIKEKIGRG